MSNPQPTDYELYLQRILARENVISNRIRNIRDPIDAINTIVHNEGSNLKAMWESEAGYPIDGILLCIIFLPVALGVLASYVASVWEPRLIGEEQYDDYGNRVVEFPRMPIAYLQQTRKDQSAARENRNSLAWLCHTWLISTNDVVQELLAPYPLDENTKGWGTVKALSKLYSMFRQAAKDWKETQLQNEKREEANAESNVNAEDEAQKPAGGGGGAAGGQKMGGKLKTIFKKSQVSDVLYIQRRLHQARRLWRKLNEWAQEYNGNKKKDDDDSDESSDSYWSSSETFSSDSGAHWKKYKNTTAQWARGKALHARWKNLIRKSTAQPKQKLASNKPAVTEELVKEPKVKIGQNFSQQTKNAYKKVKPSAKPSGKPVVPKPSKKK